MAPRKKTRPWIPVPMRWEAARFGEDGTRLRLAYVTNDGVPADRADVAWHRSQLTITLSRMKTIVTHERLPAIYHCVELRLSTDASDRELVDGASGEFAALKRSRYFNDEDLRNTERTWDMVFEPREFLEPREVGL